MNKGGKSSRLVRNRFLINNRPVRSQFRSRKSVLKMLAVMEASQSAGPSHLSSGSNNSNTSGGGGGVEGAPPTPDSTTHAQEFLSSGRTGRRNALPDILGQHAVVTSSDLPAKLQALTTSDESSAGASAASTSSDLSNPQPGPSGKS